MLLLFDLALRSNNPSQVKMIVSKSEVNGTSIMEEDISADGMSGLKMIKINH